MKVDFGAAAPAGGAVVERRAVGLHDWCSRLLRLMILAVDMNVSDIESMNESNAKELWRRFFNDADLCSHYLRTGSSALKGHYR